MNERLLCRALVWKEFFSGLAALFIFFGTVGQARSQFLYWSNYNGGTVQRANLDGTGAVILADNQNSPKNIALDVAGGLMYWTQNGPVSGSGDIRRANLDGSGQTILISGLAGPAGPALDLAGGLMYWTQFDTGEIWRARLDGSDPTRLVNGLSSPRGIALDLAGGQIYWTEFGRGTISRANLDGTGLETLVHGLAPRNLALDLPGGRMYWTDGEIRRANLDDPEASQETVISGLPNPFGIALDLANGKIYWSDFVSAGDIRRANLDGSGQEILVTGLPSPLGIALDLGAPGTALFYAIAAPATVPSGTAFDVTLTAADPYGTIDVNYQGTVTFSTSDPDPGIALPADYTFTAGDAGVHTFTGGVTLITPGDQTITVTDTASGITGSITITVGPVP